MEHIRGFASFYLELHRAMSVQRMRALYLCPILALACGDVAKTDAYAACGLFVIFSHWLRRLNNLGSRARFLCLPFYERRSAAAEYHTIGACIFKCVCVSAYDT